MTDQLVLNFSLDGHAHLRDYIGEARFKLVQLTGFIYLHGLKGSGKSHLLQGMCHRAIEEGRSALYFRDLSMLEPAVLEGLDHIDLICLDDLDSVIESYDWQLALFHLVNVVKDAGKTLIISSAIPVSGLNVGLSDLDSRIKGAYRLATDYLDDEKKLEVIGSKARHRGFYMSEEVCRFILSRAHRDMHYLARLVDQLDQETLRRQKKVTIPLVKVALGL